MQTLFKTKRLFIRACTLDDVDALKPILGDPEVMEYSLNGALDQKGILKYLKERILVSCEKQGYGLWALIHQETGEFIGIAGLMNQIIDEEEVIEIGYRLAKRYWGLGFATEAVEGIKEYAFHKLNMTHLISIIDPSNKRSVNVAKKAGMKRIKSTSFHGFHVDIYAIHILDRDQCDR